MSQLMDLPEEVLESSILPFLPWNDLLRCRRVCKAIKGVTDDFIRLHPENAKAPEIEVTEQTGKDLKAFLGLRIPITKLFLNNPTGHEFFDNLDTTTLTCFMTTYGPMITSLRVTQLSVSPCFNERTFLEALTNLKTFEAGGYGCAGLQHLVRAITDPRWPRSPDFTYPLSFKNLEILKIGYNKQYFSHNNSDCFALFLSNLPKLDYISFPFCSDTQDADDQQLHPFVRIINKMSLYILVKGAGRQKPLTFFDFINYHEEKVMQIEVIDEMYEGQSEDFLALCVLSTIFNVKLLNVNPAWYHQQPDFPDFNFSILGSPIVSLVNLHTCVLPLDMPHLERINICQTSRSNVGLDWNVCDLTGLP